MGHIKAPASIEQIRSMYSDQKWSVNRIAEHFAVTRQAIYERMRYVGIVYKSKKGLGATEIPRSELERLYARERLTIAEIARQIGFSWGVVARALDRYGIERINNRELKELTLGLASMKVGDRLELETDGRYPFWIYHESKRLNYRIAVRTTTSVRFLIIRTPLLEPKIVRSLADGGISPKEMARIFMVSAKTIKKMMTASSDLD